MAVEVEELIALVWGGRDRRSPKRRKRDKCSLGVSVESRENGSREGCKGRTVDVRVEREGFQVTGESNKVMVRHRERGNGES